MERTRPEHLPKDVGATNSRNSLWKEYPDKTERKAALGQFLTPTPVADLMASFFEQNRRD
jgi:hypothetical protein